GRGDLKVPQGIDSGVDHNKEQGPFPKEKRENDLKKGETLRRGRTPPPKGGDEDLKEGSKTLRKVEGMGGVAVGANEPNMDKEWLNLPRASQASHQGVNRFLDFAFRNVGTSSGEILCPCTRCVNGLFQKRDTVEEHLVMRGFANHYRIWTDHGEVNHGKVQGEGNTPLNDVDNRDPVHEVEVDRMPELVNDIIRNRLQDDPCTKAAKFEKYMNEANQELYPGCKSETKLSFIVWLFNLKCTIVALFINSSFTKDAYMSPGTAIDMYLEDGKNCSRTEMYIVSRTCKDGTVLEPAKEKLSPPSPSPSPSLHLPSLHLTAAPTISFPDAEKPLPVVINRQWWVAHGGSSSGSGSIEGGGGLIGWC
ncbi:hypothetical protein RJ639_035428, partial [Escallonia herrerae]